MSPRYRPPTIAEVGIEQHMTEHGVDTELVKRLIKADLSNAAIGRVVGKHPKTIAQWRKYLEKS